MFLNCRDGQGGCIISPKSNLWYQLKNLGRDYESILTGKGANIDTTTPTGKLMFGFFAALAEFEHDLIIERTKAGLESARARGRKGGRRFVLTKSQIRLAQAQVVASF
ncbi:MAG: recombinase family protein [Gammaproteobacteria bacterium]|nr:recombinase family protein [Gammaproteobacteria bacterium]